MDRGWVPTDERLRTNLPNVYAVGDIVPGLQLAHRGFGQGIFVAEEIAGLQPEPIDEIGHPASHLLRAGDRLGRADRVPGEIQVRGRGGRELRIQPRRQRQEPDPRDHGLHQVGPSEGRSRRRRPHGRCADRRTGRRGPADLQLGGTALRCRPSYPRPSHPERGPRRGASRARGQAAACPRLRRHTDRQVRRPPAPRRRSQHPMSVPVNMPQLGESVTEGTVTRWLKSVGDTVARDEPLLEVSTDKVDTEIPSPVSGVLLQILADEDDVVEVGGDLAVIGDPSEAAAAAPAAPAAAPAPAPAATPAPAPAAAAQAQAEPAPSVAAAATAGERQSAFRHACHAARARRKRHRRYGDALAQSRRRRGGRGRAAGGDFHRQGRHRAPLTRSRRAAGHHRGRG